MYKVLLVDDERIIREGIASIIDWQSLGLIFIGAAQNGLEAYEMIQKEQPRIVITDLKMPALDGLELISRAKEKFPEIQFVILSGFGEFELARQAMYLGVRHYLLKPCNENQIIEVLKEITGELLQKESAEAAPDFDFDFGPIAQAIKQGDIERVNGELDSFFSQIRLNAIGIQNIKPYALELFIAIIRQCPGEEFENYINKIIELQKLNSLDLIYGFIKNTGLRLARLHQEQTAAKGNAKGCITQNKLILTILDYIQEHLSDENLSLKWLASRLVYMNEGYLSKLFFKETGEKFSHYLTRVRMEKAKELVEKSGYDLVCEVARKVGYGNNPQYFSQLFKKYTGFAPSDYRKEPPK